MQWSARAAADCTLRVPRLQQGTARRGSRCRTVLRPAAEPRSPGTTAWAADAVIGGLAAPCHSEGACVTGDRGTSQGWGVRSAERAPSRQSPLRKVPHPGCVADAPGRQDPLTRLNRSRSKPNGEWAEHPCAALLHDCFHLALASQTELDWPATGLFAVTALIAVTGLPSASVSFARFFAIGRAFRRMQR